MDRDAARAPGMLRTCLDLRQVLPDGRPDAGQAALRAGLGFARCSPRSLFNSLRMSLRCSFVIRLSPFGRFLPCNSRVRNIVRFSTFCECEDGANGHPTFNRREYMTQPDTGHATTDGIYRPWTLPIVFWDLAKNISASRGNSPAFSSAARRLRSSNANPLHSRSLEIPAWPRPQ